MTAFKLTIWLILATTLTSLCRAGDELPAPEEVLHKVLARARLGTTSPPSSYQYTRQTVTQDLDPAGRIVNRKVQVRTNRSRPIGPAEATRWSNSHGVNLDEELITRYAFHLARRIEWQGRPTLEIVFTPKNPPAPVHRPLDRLLNRAAGTLWVDEEECELARADLHLIQPVNLSILGAVDQLNFRFERTRSADGNWLTTRTETTFQGRRLTNPIQFRQVTEYSGYQRI